MKDYKLEHKLMRMKVWSDAWSRVSGSPTCTDISVATMWADKALDAFDQEFGDSFMQEQYEGPQIPDVPPAPELKIIDLERCTPEQLKMIGDLLAEHEED